jgi:dihydroorotase
MTILLKTAKIIDPKSSFHSKTFDILIKDGMIQKVGKNLSDPKAKIIQLDNLHVSQGWFDSSISFGEPGFEERETLSHGLEVAQSSGFAHIAYNTNTSPRPINKADISFLFRKASNAATSIYPKAGVSSENNQGKLAELHDLFQAGAVAFSNHKKPLDDAHLLVLALQYTQGFDGLVESFPMDSQLCKNGLMHEGKISTTLGLPGIPNLAEELRIGRDLALLAYTGGKLHIPTISSAGSVEMIKNAKKQGLDVSCSVAIHNLVLTDESLLGFDTRYKTMPPLRSATDQKALIKGVKDGVIDMVTSDHQPMDIEHKKMELEHAEYGSIGLETAFGALNGIFGLEESAVLLSQGKIRFGVPENTIEEGATADLTLFSPEGTHTHQKSSILSNSKNSAYLGMKFSGTVYGIIAKNSLHLTKD